MEKTIDNKRVTDNVSVGQKKKKGSQLNPLRHGLYLDPRRLKIDYRAIPGRKLRKIETDLLARFNGAAPASAKLLASRVSFKILRALSFEAAVVRKGEQPSASTDQDYLKLSNSIRADLQLLATLARDVKPSDKDLEPCLEDYLKKSQPALAVIPKKEVTHGKD